MSETKFTKGPWKIEGGQFWSGNSPATEFTFMRADDFTFDFDNEADRALIAAAPDLYEALNACLGLLTGNMDGDLPDERDPKEMARAALRKARGESTASKGEGE